jgi:Arc/MetJ-type ribon-helix-helix transcriptional regulator
MTKCQKRLCEAKILNVSFHKKYLKQIEQWTIDGFFARKADFVRSAVNYALFVKFHQIGFPLLKQDYHKNRQNFQIAVLFPIKIINILINLCDTGLCVSRSALVGRAVEMLVRDIANNIELMEKYGKTADHKKIKSNNGKIKMAQNMKADGFNVFKIAKTLNLKPSTIRNYIGSEI